MDKTNITIKTYNKIAKKFDEKYCKIIYYKKQLDNFVKYIKPKSKILDVGCGTGHVARYLSKKGFDIIGIDLSESMLKLAKIRAPEVKFKLMDLRKIKFKQNSFDVIISLFSLNHINNKDFEKIIRTLFKILKNNGFLFLALPEGNKEEIIQEPLNKKQKIYFNYYLKNYVCKILKINKFNILKVEDRFLRKEGYNEFFIISLKQT